MTAPRYSILTDLELIRLQMGIRVAISECESDIEHAQARLQIAQQTDKLISEELSRRFNETVD